MINENMNGRKERVVIRNCMTALGDYAALVATDTKSDAKAKEINDIVGTMASYWGFEHCEGGKTVEEFQQEFEDRVDDALRGNTIDVDTFSACSDALTGLALYAEEMQDVHGGDEFAMNEMLRAGDLLVEIADYYGVKEEVDFAKDSAKWVTNRVKDMLKEYGLPGNPIEGESKVNYAIKQAILYDNNQGFAFAHNPAAASPFVTWRIYKNEENKLEFEQGNYFSSEEKALVDYISRVERYVPAAKANEIQIPSQVQQQDEWRTYKAEIHLPDTEYPHLKVFGADNDVDAVEKAHELASEQVGAYLLEVHELNDDNDSIRQIDLLYHDPDARRYMDVDIIGFLGQIADKTVIGYPGDFKIDTNEFWKSALSENPEDKKLMWHCCSYGTHLLNEDEVFIRSTGAHGYWCDYRPKEQDMVGFAVEVTGYKDETVVGNVYDVGNYYSHAQYVRENSAVLDAVSLTYHKDWGINAGKTITVPRYEYDKDRHRLMSESGNVTAIKYHPSESSQTMENRLKAEKAKYMGMPVGDTKDYLTALDKKLLHLRGELDPKETVRIYHADYNDPEHKEVIAAVNDADALKQATEICTEATRLVLVELNEVGENGDMREVEIPAQAAELMPDPTITVAARDEYGYSYEEMLPLNHDRAMDLYMQDNEIFLLWNDGTESVVYDSSEITNHDGIFGIERDTWLKSEAYKDMAEELAQDSKSAPVNTAEKQAEAEKPASKDEPAKKPKKPYRGEDR